LTVPWRRRSLRVLSFPSRAAIRDSGGVLPTSHFLQYALDTGFNSTGTLVTGSSGSYDSVAIQPSSSDIVVAGVSGSNLFIVRYNANGSLDTTFGTSGVAFSESSPTFAELALDSSGNIDVAVNSGSNVEVYQLSDTGSTNWSTALTFATGVVPQGIALEPSGDIIVAGDSSSGAGIYLAGLNPSTGAVDTSFGSSGYVNAPLSGAPSGLSVALDSSGKILVAGSDSGDFSVVRFTSSGSLDTSFNSTGEVTVSLGGTDKAYAVAPGPGGTIVAAGVAVISGSNDDAPIRLTGSGALDTSFNSTGKIVGSSGSGTIRAILVQTNGEVLAGGDASSGTAQKVWMFTPAGAADTAFASGGTLTANSGATVYGWAVASGPTQRIVVAGSYGGDAALAAFAPDSVRLYAQQDQNYNVTSMADPYGNVVQRYVYDPYGNMTVLSAAWTPQSDLFNTQVGFQGMWLDAASGLYHTLNRDYSAALGRWMEQDPAGYVNGDNLSQFLMDLPENAVDPDGLAVAATNPAAQDTRVASISYAVAPKYTPFSVTSQIQYVFADAMKGMYVEQINNYVLTVWGPGGTQIANISTYAVDLFKITDLKPPPDDRSDEAVAGILKNFNPRDINKACSFKVKSSGTLKLFKTQPGLILNSGKTIDFTGQRGGKKGSAGSMIIYRFDAQWTDQAGKDQSVTRSQPMDDGNTAVEVGLGQLGDMIGRTIDNDYTIEGTINNGKVSAKFSAITWGGTAGITGAAAMDRPAREQTFDF